MKTIAIHSLKGGKAACLMAKLGMIRNAKERSGTKDGRSISLTVRDIPIGSISVRSNARMEYTGIEELAASIRQYGLLQPITVYAEGERFIVKAGHRRYMACKSLYSREPERFHSVRCVISDADNATIIQLVENVQRVDLPQTDLFNALSALREQGMTLKQIAEVMGKTEGHIKNLFVGVNEISKDESLKAMIGHAGVTIGDIAETAAVPDRQERLNLLEERKKGTASRSDLRKKVKELKSANQVKKRPHYPMTERVKISMKVIANSREIVLFTDKGMDEKQFLPIVENVRKFFVLHDGYDLEIVPHDKEPKAAKTGRSGK
jgi:ParB family chromosome partitioning protein